MGAINPQRSSRPEHEVLHRLLERPLFIAVAIGLTASPVATPIASPTVGIAHCAASAAVAAIHMRAAVPALLLLLAWQSQNRSVPLVSLWLADQSAFDTARGNSVVITAAFWLVIVDCFTSAGSSPCGNTLLRPSCNTCDVVGQRPFALGTIAVTMNGLFQEGPIFAALAHGGMMILLGCHRDGRRSREAATPPQAASRAPAPAAAAPAMP